MEQREQRVPKARLSLKKNIPVSNPAPTPNVQESSPREQIQPPQEYPDFNVEHATADASPLEWLEVDEYYSHRKKPHTSNRTHRSEQLRKEGKWR